MDDSAVEDLIETRLSGLSEKLLGLPEHRSAPKSTLRQRQAVNSGSAEEEFDKPVIDSSVIDSSVTDGSVVDASDIDSSDIETSVIESAVDDSLIDPAIDEEIPDA